MYKRAFNLFNIFNVIIFCGLIGCKGVVETPQPITPLYKYLEDFKKMTPFERDSLMKADSLEIDLMMKFIGVDTVTEEVLERWSESKVVEMFTPVVDSVFPNLDNLENTLGLILENAENDSLDFFQYRYAAVVWGARYNIVSSDSVILIALNHFLGKDFEGYKEMYEYIRRNKTPEQLPYDLASCLLNSRYPYELTESSTALSRMLYEGAIIYISLQIVPNATLSEALGYTSEELEWLNNHYNEMWEKMIGKDLIYSTSRTVASRLIGPAPNTSIISPEYPGRAGRYLGYRLIFNYMQNNAKTPLKTLLYPTFYNNSAELVLMQ